VIIGQKGRANPPERGRSPRTRSVAAVRWWGSPATVLAENGLLVLALRNPVRFGNACSEDDRRVDCDARGGAVCLGVKGRLRCGRSPSPLEMRADPGIRLGSPRAPHFAHPGRTAREQGLSVLWATHLLSPAEFAGRRGVRSPSHPHKRWPELRRIIDAWIQFISSPTPTADCDPRLR
jgi:hypothetical protein